MQNKLLPAIAISRAHTTYSPTTKQSICKEELAFSLTNKRERERDQCINGINNGSTYGRKHTDRMSAVGIGLTMGKQTNYLGELRIEGQFGAHKYSLVSDSMRDVESKGMSKARIKKSRINGLVRGKM